jgi:hypothetical protein
MWQDHVIAGVQWVFAIALIPALVEKQHKPPMWTSVITALGLAIIAFAQATLGLWHSTGVCLVIALMWAVLAIQRSRL